MLTILRFCVLLVLVFAAVGDAKAQGTWLVDPGRGVGPLQVGMLQEDVVRAVGQPTRISDVTAGQYIFGKNWRYNQLGLDVLFLLDSSPSLNRDFKNATSIEVWGQTLRTRGGVGVGSTLTEVVRVFGDSMRQVREQGQALHALECVETGVVLNSSTSEVAMYVYYRQIGIDFSLSADGRVRRMTVKKTAECLSVSPR